MTPYLLLAGGASLFLGLGYLTERRRGVRRAGSFTFFDALALIAMIVFAGLRTNVGTDFPAYRRVYEAKLVPGYFWESLSASGHDFGFAVLETLIRHVGLSFESFVFLLSVLTVGTSFWAIWWARIGPRIGSMVYLALIFPVPLNLIRQGLAMSLVMLAVVLVRRGQRVSALGVSVLAISMHYSAVLAILGLVAVLVLAAAQTGSRLVWGVLIGGVGLLLTATGYFVRLISFVNPRYEGYLGEAGSGLGTQLGIVFRVGLILAAYILLKNDEGVEGRFETYAIAMGLAFMVLGLGSLSVSRLDLYFFQFSVFLVPRCLAVSQSRVGVRAVYVMGIALFYVAQVVYFGGIAPYDHVRIL